MKPSWFSEIEKFPSKVLAHHWPAVPNLGDMTKLPERIASGEIDAPDLLVGGTPCQAFSVAGLRKSLDDARGNLTLTYVRILDAIDAVRSVRGQRAAHCIWENVPGVLSTKDNAFGCFLAGLVGAERPLEADGRWPNAGLVSGPKRTAVWRVLDAQHFGVPQRRRRVFVVAGFGGISLAQVLFEPQGLQWDPAACRPKREKAAGNAGEGIAGSHWDGSGTHPTLNQSHNVGGIGASNQELFSQRGAGLVPTTVCMAHGQGGAEISLNRCPTLTCNHEAPIAFNWMEARTFRASEESSNPLTKSQTEAVAVNWDGGHISQTLTKSLYGGQGWQSMPDKGNMGAYIQGTTVRRMTPTECERLQGFPDGHTAIPGAADGPRYKALGNSMAVPCMRFIGKRFLDYMIQ